MFGNYPNLGHNVFFFPWERERERGKKKKKEIGAEKKETSRKILVWIFCVMKLHPERKGEKPPPPKKKSKSSLVVESSNNITWREEISSLYVSDLTWPTITSSHRRQTDIQSHRKNKRHHRSQNPKADGNVVFFPYEIGVSFCTQLLSGGPPFYSLFLSLPPEGFLLSLINYHRVFGICCKREETQLRAKAARGE